MFVQITQSFFQSFHIRFFDTVETDTSVHLQSLCRSDNHRETRLESTLAALDIVELLCTKISTESGFCDYIIAERHCQFSGQNRVTTMRNISERTAVYKSSGSFRSLHQIRMDGIFQQHSDSSCHSQIFYSKRLVIIREAQQDVFDTTTQITHIFGKTKNRHNFRSRSNIETGLLGNPVRFRSKTDNDAAQRTVVHIKHSPPKNFFQSETFCLVLIEIIVEQSRNHVMGRGNGVKIPCEMKVNLIHRKHLCISSTGRSSLHSETRTERRFTKSDNRILSNFIQSQSKTDRYGSFANARFGCRDSSDQDEIAFLHFLFINQLFRDLCDVATIILHFLARNSDTFGNLLNLLQLNAASNFYV